MARGWWHRGRFQQPSFPCRDGPFHVYINVVEDHVVMTRFLYGPLFKFNLWSRIVDQPKIFRCELILAAAFLGWKNICQQILQKFTDCKDLEYICIINILDEVLPAVVLHYPVIFKSGNTELYRATRRRLSILFMIWRRHHYDKSTLSWLNDFHQECFKAVYLECRCD